jgi:hypothetical protein
MGIMNRDISFLWFKPTLAEAWNQNASPVVDLMYRGQLHLLPFDPQPYIQITDSPISLQIQNDSNVYLLDCTGEELEINNHVDLQSITDTNGIKQIYIRLKYLPVDYGMNLVCLKIVSVEDTETNTYYSNPFLLTSLGWDRTSRVDYRVTRNYADPSTETIYTNLYQGVRLSFYYNRHVDATELDTYYQISKSQDVIANVNENDRIEWMWEKADSWHWVRLSKALYRSPCYINQERNYPSEGLELQSRDGDTNVSESAFITSPNPSDRINIIEIIIDPDIDFVPFLASSSALVSASYLVSQSEIPET